MTLSCPICGSDRTRPVAGPPTRWRYQQCLGCQHRWLHPPPTQAELDTYYNSAYAVALDAYLAQVRREAPLMQHLLASIGRRSGRMLEIGCSYGAMLATFQQVGWEVAGLELDDRAVAYARQHYSFPVVNGRVEMHPDGLSPPYDVITLYHVLEHIVDPMPFAAQLRRLARDGSLVVLKTPNVQSAVARLTRGWWQWAAVPEHVHLYSPMSLRILLQQAGFRFRSCTSRRGDADAPGVELVRALGKRIRSRRSGANANGAAREEAGSTSPRRPAPMRSRPWYHAVSQTIRLATAPAFIPLDVAGRLGALVHPELLVVAETTGPAPASP